MNSLYLSEADLLELWEEEQTLFYAWEAPVCNDYIPSEDEVQLDIERFEWEDEWLNTELMYAPEPDDGIQCYICSKWDCDEHSNLDAQTINWIMSHF